MATPVPPRCDADHNFCDDSERFRKPAAGGLLAFRCIRPSAVRNGHAPMLLLRARPRLLPNARQLGGRVDEEVAHPHPSQTRMCRFPASGSSWESLARGGADDTIRDLPAKNDAR